MLNLDDITTKNNDKDWPFRFIVIGPSGSGKTNYLINKIQTDNNIIDKIYLYAKDLQERKYQLLIKKKYLKYEYEYLTGANLGYKPDVVQKAKFEYSPLGQVFNKGLETSDKKKDF